MFEEFNDDQDMAQDRAPAWAAFSDGVLESGQTVRTAAIEAPWRAARDGKSMSKTFAARLNRLFDTVYPPGRGPHTSVEVITALKAEGITTVSAPYLSQLRSGNRTNQSAATMAALANFFRVKPAYFTDDEYYQKLDKELTWLATMRDEGVRRIAARTVGLSAQAQDDVAAKVEELRRTEHLVD